MKHSKYIMVALWDVPESYCGPVAIRWDMNGNPTHFTHKPAFIAKYRTDPVSPEGFIVCVRKLEITRPELN